MPRLSSKLQLLDGLTRAITESGWQVIYLSTLHPFSLQVFNETESYRVRIYIWNMTHGGGKARPLDEYRIQITPKTITRFEPEPGGKTLILGWWEDAGVYAGFDYRRHSEPLGASPSMQIREEYLRHAYTNGLSACSKGNREIAVAFRPDFLVEYIRNLDRLHDIGNTQRDLEILEAVAARPDAVNDEDIQRVTVARQTMVVSVRKALRDISFKQRVLTAYRYGCAVCAVQLNLVEAAHIVPVAAEGSTDETSNGVALCSLHHDAFDKALIAIADDYSVLLNEIEIERLAHVRRDGGLKKFRSALRPIIILPPSVTDRPHVEYLRRGREVRRWSN